MLTTASANDLANQHPHLSQRAKATRSSAIRELLDQANQPGMISLAGGLPDPTLFPHLYLAESAAHRMADANVLQYGPTRGHAATRAALATLFGNVTADQVVVTTGSQQGLDLLARTLLDPGDTVVVGDPDYLGALQVFRGYGAQLAPINIDGDGFVTDELEDQLAKGLRPKLLYVVPHFHNPTGARLSGDRRQHLGALASRYGFVIVDDDPYRELFYDETQPDSGWGDAVVVRLRSTSKVLAPGLRVGAVSGPDWLLDKLVVLKQSTDLHTSTLGQAIVTDALTSSWFPGHLATLRASYVAKRDLLAAALTDRFGDRIRVSVPAGGMFVWAEFGDVDTAHWLQRALRAGVCFVPGEAFSVTRDLTNAARFSFATASPQEIATAVRRLEASLLQP